MDDSLTVGCPDCHAKKGEPCVYLWPKDHWSGEPRVRERTRSAQVLEQMDRAGKPMKRSHNGRARKLWLKKAVAKRKAREAELLARSAPSREREEILRANADALAREHEQLRAWL